MNNNYSYRRASAADTGQLKQLALLSYGQFSNVLGADNWQKMAANLNNDAMYEDLLNTSKAFVCESVGGICGMVFLVGSGNATAFFEKDWCYIRLLGVHPAHGKNGIGKKLMQLCVEEAGHAGEKTMALHTGEFHLAAKTIYVKMGFIKEKELDPIFGKRYFLYKLQLPVEQEGPTLHLAAVEDVPTLAKLRLMFAAELSGPKPPELVQILQAQLNAYFLKATAAGTCISFIAKIKGNVAGIGTVHIRDLPGNFKNPSGKWGYIMNMYTLAPYRRKGVCKSILNALVKEGAARGITAFELHATEEGEMVYRQQGFEIHSQPTYRRFLKS